MCQEEAFADFELNPKIFTFNNAYVCWLDIMGTESIMRRSVKTALAFVCKLHIAALTARANFQDDAIRLYPMMDGVYIITFRKNMLLAFLHQTMRPLVDIFLEESVLVHRFIARGAIAYGPIIEGHLITNSNALSGKSMILRDNPDYTRCLVAGIPVAQAHKYEVEAPPFGIYIHESARAFAPEGEEPFTVVFWDWIDAENRPVSRKKLLDELRAYFDWYGAHSLENEYNKEAIERHKRLAEEWLLP